MDAQVMRAARPASGPLAEIERAKGLLDKGIISQAEFDTIKANAIASMGQGGTAPVYPQYVGSMTWLCSQKLKAIVRDVCSYAFFFTHVAGATC